MFKPEIVDRFQRDAAAPIQWGHDDCCQWVRRIVIAHGGPDLMSKVRPYDTQAGALAATGGCLVTAAIGIAEWHGLKKVNWPFEGAHVGVVAGDLGPALAIKYYGAWLGRAERGAIAYPNRQAVLAWSIPCHK